MPRNGHQEDTDIIWFVLVVILDKSYHMRDVSVGNLHTADWNLLLQVSTFGPDAAQLIPFQVLEQFGSILNGQEEDLIR